MMESLGKVWGGSRMPDASTGVDEHVDGPAGFTILAPAASRRRCISGKIIGVNDDKRVLPTRLAQRW
jgi:hypothetical protein